jgi:hypothetical protein
MLTVRQVLVDSALSRLPEVWPLNKKLALVDDVMVCASDLHSFVLLCLT